MPGLFGGMNEFLMDMKRKTNIFKERRNIMNRQTKFPSIIIFPFFIHSPGEVC